MRKSALVPSGYEVDRDSAKHDRRIEGHQQPRPARAILYRIAHPLERGLRRGRLSFDRRVLVVGVEEHLDQGRTDEQPTQKGDRFRSLREQEGGHADRDNEENHIALSRGISAPSIGLIDRRPPHFIRKQKEEGELEQGIGAEQQNENDGYRVKRVGHGLYHPIYYDAYIYRNRT